MRRFAGGLQLHTTDLDDINLDEVDKPKQRAPPPPPPPPPPPTVTPALPAHPPPASNAPRGPALLVTPASQQLAPSPPTQRHPGVPIVSKPVMLHPDPNFVVRPTIKSEALVSLLLSFF
ncbi:harmonin-like [Melospiza melodia melodia]|uniref:harmonin-like n=1 Tax=Melospiza melodia melodia TaxID=1914991 RepID=UPI002FD43DD4